MEARISNLRERIFAAKGEVPADLVLKKGRVVNVCSGRIHEGDVAIHQGRIVGLGPRYQGKKEVDIEGKWVVPGLMDAHIHIESSMLLPSKLAEALLTRGTTTIVADPHEIANVMGAQGIEFMLEESRDLPFDIFFMAPSCVPATHMESSGAEMDASALLPFRRNKRILGLAEMMNYPGVLAGDADVLEKLIIFREKRVDGHSPSLKGFDLQGYVAAGIGSDHETSEPGEGWEKLDSGMMLMIREGTSAKNMEALLPIAMEGNSHRCCFVSDDLHAQDIQGRGHLNFVIRMAIKQGMDPVTAVQMATLNPAEYMGLKDRGAVAPGYRADLVVLSDLESFSVDQVYKDGQLVFNDGVLVPFPERQPPPIAFGPLNTGSLAPSRFHIENGSGNARIIELVAGEILTRTTLDRVKSEKDGVVADIERDILKLAVIERHKGTGRMGMGLVRGFGLQGGAIASSVAHDSHNVIVVGTNDRDMCHAAETLRDMGGGMVAVHSETTLAKVPLQVAGLMSVESVDVLVKQLNTLEQEVASLGCSISDPFMRLSFLALPVIPQLRLTDRGLVDVDAFDFVPLFVQDR